MLEYGVENSDLEMGDTPACPHGDYNFHSTEERGI